MLKSSDKDLGRNNSHSKRIKLQKVGNNHAERAAVAQFQYLNSIWNLFMLLLLNYILHFF